MRGWTVDGMKRLDDARVVRRWAVDGTKRSDDARVVRRWAVDGTKRSDDARQKLFTKFFSLLFLRKEFLFKKFFMIPFISFYPPKNRESSGAFDDVAVPVGKGRISHIHTTTRCE